VDIVAPGRLLEAEQDLMGRHPPIPLAEGGREGFGCEVGKAPVQLLALQVFDIVQAVGVLKGDACPLAGRGGLVAGDEEIALLVEVDGVAGQVELVCEGLVEAQALLHEGDVHRVGELGAHGLEGCGRGQGSQRRFSLQDIHLEPGASQEVGAGDADDAAADDEDAGHGEGEGACERVSVSACPRSDGRHKRRFDKDEKGMRITYCVLRITYCVLRITNYARHPLPSWFTFPPAPFCQGRQREWTAGVEQ